MSSRCNTYCWPPAVSRRTDRFAGFSRLLRNHQSYSAIRSPTDNVAPRDTRARAIIRCPSFHYDRSQLFRLSTPPINYVRSCTSIIYWNIIQYTSLFIQNLKFSLTKALVLKLYIDGRAILIEHKAAVTFRMFYIVDAKNATIDVLNVFLDYFKDKYFIICL